MFPLNDLREVAEVFGCSSLSNDYVEGVHLSENEKSKKPVMLHVWFGYFLE